MHDLPFVSVVFPCLNENKYISACLDSVIANEYPKEKLEVLLCDGMSDDGTREIITSYIRKYPYIKLLDNPQKSIPNALNIGIKNSKGTVIVRMDVHAKYENDYIKKCAERLIEYDVDNVGGIIITKPKESGFLANAIVATLTSSFGVGNSLFRIGSNKPLEVDTVFGGCFRRTLFDKIGFYDENITRSEDLEFNSRIKQNGGKIILFPDIKATYYARANFLDYCRYSYIYGFCGANNLKFVSKGFLKIRHFIPPTFVATLAGSFLLGILLTPKFFWVFALALGAYFPVAFYFSFKVASKDDWRYFFILPILFFCRHIFFGCGSIWGILKAVGSKEFWVKRIFKTPKHRTV